MKRILMLFLISILLVPLALAQFPAIDAVNAVDRGDEQLIQKWCKESPQAVTTIVDAERGRYLTHRAIMLGQLDVLKALHNTCGMSVTAVDGTKRSPIELAVSGGHTDVALYLIDQGNDVNYVRRPPTPPGFPPRVDPLIKTVIHARASLSVLEAMIRAGADLSITDADGHNVLHICTLADNYNAAELLLRRYKNRLPLDATDNEGYLPIAYSRSDEMERLFRSYNAF